MTDEKTKWSKVDFPADADPDTAEAVEVYLNGIRQVRGEDFELDATDRTLYFFKPIRKEEKLGGWRWFWLFIGVAGSYKQNDSVDVVCDSGGQRKHHVNLPIDVLVEPTEEQKGMLKGSYSPGG
jgi:hypothetical protein